MVKEIKTAVLLAAGKGERLKPHTNDKPKCLVEVGNNTLLGHLVNALEMHHFEKLIIVTGYKADKIRKYLDSKNISLSIEYVHNKVYDTTNNIYSLWLAHDSINDDFILVESDLIFEPDILNEVKQADKIVLDRFDPIVHNGTTAEVNENGSLKKIYTKTSPPADATLYKTVNIYSFSFETWKKIRDEIGKYIGEGKTHIFYEYAIKKLVENDQISLSMVDLSDTWWDEIDTVEDLERVENKLLNPHTEVDHNRKQSDL